MKYLVTLDRTEYQTGSIAIEADDEDQAEALVQAMIDEHVLESDERFAWGSREPDESGFRIMDVQS